MLSVVERKDMESYINHSMNIGAFPQFVQENQRPFDVLYRGIMCHPSKLVMGASLEHWEPLLSCSTSLAVSEEFAVLGVIPEDVVEDLARQKGFKDTGDTADNELYNQAYDEFVPIVLEIQNAQGLRILDYIHEYEYAKELEVVVKATPLTILKVKDSETELGVKYLLVTVTV